MSSRVQLQSDQLQGPLGVPAPALTKISHLTQFSFVKPMSCMPMISHLLVAALYVSPLPAL